MGRRGPPAKPTKLKLLEGTFRPDRAPVNEPQPTAGAPPMPSWIRGDKDARVAWDMALEELGAMGMLCRVDGSGLEGFAASYSRAVKAQRLIKKKGVVIETPFGDKANPACGIADKAWAAVKGFGQLYGFNPSSRSRLEAPPKEGTKDQAEDFLFGRKRGA